MESDKSGGPEEAVIEKDVPIVVTPDASETPLVAAVESAEQPSVNDPTEEQSAGTPEGKQDMDSPPEEPKLAPSDETPSEEQEPLPEKVSDPVQASTPCLPNTEEQSLPQNDSEPSEVPQINGPTETEPEKSAEPQLETTPAQSALVESPNPEEKASEVVEAATAGVVSTEVEAANLEPKEVQKEVEADVAESDPIKASEVASEQTAAEPPKEEDALPVADSLSFALLEMEQTKKALQSTQTLVVLRGLPGSGKSFLARAIADDFKEHCAVICADDYGVVPENLASGADGYKALDEAIVALCGGEKPPVLIVVDDTNHTQDRLARLGEIAVQHCRLAIFLEPHTEWSRDPEQLSKKNKRGLEVAQLEAMRLQLEEVMLPLFFGWFLLPPAQEKIKCSAIDFVKTLDTLEAFKKHSADYTGKADKEVDLEQFFKANASLHCTTKFCNYGKAEGAIEYAQSQVVKDLYSSVFELSLIAFFVTPRTVGARVSLTEEQLKLWPLDAESSVPGAAGLPHGSRAHVTLACAAGVEAVQTGLDLLNILALQDGQQGELVEEMELGSLSYYGEGRWMLALREPICASACFSSSYERKEPEPPKLEKKKKPKCTIL